MPTFAVRQVTTAVHVQLRSSNKALKLFQVAPGLFRFGLVLLAYLTAAV